MDHHEKYPRPRRKLLQTLGKTERQQKIATERTARQSVEAELLEERQTVHLVHALVEGGWDG